MARTKKDTSKGKTKYEFPVKFSSLIEKRDSLYYTPSIEVLGNGHIVTIPEFLSVEVCDGLIDSFVKDLKMETTPLVKSKDYAARVNDRSLVNDMDTSKDLWAYLQHVLLLSENDETSPMLQKHFENGRGLNPNLRMYRYRSGHYFGKHYDELVRCSTENGGYGTTKWTLLIYLTGGDEFEGGGTIFYDNSRRIEPLNVHPSKGMALLHKHGDDCLMHEAEMVGRGEKWVLRSDVVF